MSGLRERQLEERCDRLERLLDELCKAIAAHSNTAPLELGLFGSEPPLENTANRIRAELGRE